MVRKDCTVISAGDVKKGTKILFREDPYIVLDSQHNKTGRGGALVRVKMKNLITGATVEDNFRSGEKFDSPNLEHKEMQFLYKEDELYNFMDKESFEQVALNEDSLEDVLKYLKEQESYHMLYFRERPIGVTPPLFMNLKVVDTPPGVRGDTAQGSCNKVATLETGLVVQVPLFINEGDVLKIDTRDGSYIERL